MNPIAEELTRHIDTAFAQHAVTPDTMFIVQARDEINRLEAALSVCHIEVERLYQMLNNVRSEAGRVVKVGKWFNSEPA